MFIISLIYSTSFLNTCLFCSQRFQPLSLIYIYLGSDSVATLFPPHSCLIFLQANTSVLQGHLAWGLHTDIVAQAQDRCGWLSPTSSTQQRAGQRWTLPSEGAGCTHRAAGAGDGGCSRHVEEGGPAYLLLRCDSRTTSFVVASWEEGVEQCFLPPSHNAGATV